eukprot:COSAG01_NODE_1390_length_10496_cov_8.535116_2_plen_1021_part_00
MHGFFRFLWRDARCQIREVDEAARRLSTGGAPINKGAGVTNGSLWYAYNLVEELDEPGEFVLDRATGKLSAIFPAGCVSAAAGVVCRTRVVPGVPTYANGNPTPGTALVDIAGVENVRLHNLSVSGSRGLGINIAKSSSGITIERCQLHNVLTAVAVRASRNVSLLGSRVAWTLGTATSWSGGNRSTLTAAGLLVQGNTFHDFGTFLYTYTPATQLSGVGVVVKQNQMRSNYHTAVLLSGNNHIIELNDFHHLATIGYDTGVIYGGRDLSSRGVHIRHNRFHHLDHPAPCNAYTSCIRMAVYIDDYEGGDIVEGNIFYRCLVGLFSNNGANFTLRNNLFVNVGLSIRQSGQASFDHGEVCSATATINTLYKKLHAVPYTSALWQRTYPYLTRFNAWNASCTDRHKGPFEPVGSSLPEDNLYATNTVVNATGPPTGDGTIARWYRNSHWHLQEHLPGGKALGISLWCGPATRRKPHARPPPPPTAACSVPTPVARYFDVLESNSAQTYASIQFASSDPGLALNFTLKASSPLWKLGWQRIPEEKIGPPPQLKTDDAATCSAKLLNNTDFQGNDLRRGRSITVAGCCGECYATPGCNAFSVWLDSAHPSGAECFLKRNANGKRTISDHVSAIIVNPLPPPPPPPPPIPLALKNETDCLLRSLFVEYAASVNPNIGAKEGQQMADALEGDPLMGAGCTVAVKLPPLAPPTPPPPPPAGHEVFVDGVRGRDTAAGTEAAPLRTLAQAVAVLRGSAAAGAKFISLRAVGGDSVLHLRETLRLTAADSHLTLRTAPADAAAGHRAYLSGATPLVGQQWTRVGSTHQNLWSTQLKDVHEVASMRIGGGRYWRARFPNGNPETSFPFKVGLSANHWLQSRPTHGKTRMISEPTSTNRNDTVGRDKSYSVKTGGNSCARYTPPESHYCNGDNDAGGGCVVNDTTLPHAPYRNATGAVITGMHGGMWCSFMYRVASATHAAGVTTFTFDEIGGQQCNRPEGSHGQILVENVEEELDMCVMWSLTCVSCVS